MKTLSIDTTSAEQTVVKIISDGQVVGESIKSRADGSAAQVVLQMIDQKLDEQDMAVSDLSEIVVNEGPGSFTGSRVGVTIANTLGFALGAPINNLPVGQFVRPSYSEPPKITPTH